MSSDTFAPENLRNRSFIEYKESVSTKDLVALMKSFCDHVGELTSAERETALFIIKKAIGPPEIAW